VSALVAARGIAKRYGARDVLRPCDFDLGAGAVVALLGPNGAGKSTLLSILAGAVPPTAGHVEREATVGWAPQRPALYGRLTPRENLELFARLGGAEATEVHALVRDLALERAEPASALSVGMRQRLNLALAFLGRPQVLLLDEPTAALDPEQRERLWTRLDDLRRGGGAVCFATQNLDEVERAQRVLRIEDGRLVP